MWVRPSWFSACGAGWASGALVALGCVEDELAEEFAGGGVDDADVEVLGEDGDAGSGVGAADADGVHLAAVSPGDLAGLVDLVVADAVVGFFGAVAGARRRLGAVRVDRCGGGSVVQGAVWPVLVVLLDEGVEEGLEVVNCGR